MKITISCMECLKENQTIEYGDYELEEKNIYLHKCSNGHKTQTVLQTLRHELLFDFGCIALNQGFTRESVANFVASMERFHEFCIEVFLLKTGTPNLIFEDIWKSVRKKSERQLGAFLFLFVSEFKELPPDFIMDNTKSGKKKSEFRNNVIHNGYFPKHQESYDYGESVFEYINNLTQLLTSNLPEYVEQIECNRVQKLHKEAGSINNPVYYLPTIFGRAKQEPDKVFSQWYDEIKKNHTCEHTILYPYKKN